MIPRALDISVVIPTYNRAAGTAEAVRKCLDLDPRPCEIVIVDDGSDAEAARLLSGLEQDGVKYVRLPTNAGQATARSVGLATARGKYLVSLDDDSWFLDRNALQRIWERFESLPNCGILAFRVFSPDMEILLPREQLSVVADHIGCGAAFRADVLRATGYHVSFLRYVGEEADLTIKVIGAGLDVLQDESIRVFHDYRPETRSRASLDQVRRFAVRNDLLRDWIYFPVEIALAATVWQTASHFAFSMRRGELGAAARGYVDFVRRVPQALRHRRPVARRAALKYFRLRRRPASYSA